MIFFRRCSSTGQYRSAARCNCGGRHGDTEEDDTEEDDTLYYRGELANALTDMRGLTFSSLNINYSLTMPAPARRPYLHVYVHARIAAALLIRFEDCTGSSPRACNSCETNCGVPDAGRRRDSANDPSNSLGKRSDSFALLFGMHMDLYIYTHNVWWTNRFRTI